MNKSTGFTLIDLLISLSIFVILTGIAAPSFNKYKSKNQGEAAIAIAYHLFKFSRETAIRNQNRIYICISNDGITCSRKGSESLIAFVDNNEDRQPAPSEIVKVEQLHYPDAYLKARMAFGRAYMFFEPSGRTSWTGSFIYCSLNALNRSFNKVTWNRVGRIYKGTDLNNDGQIDDRVTPKVTCA